MKTNISNESSKHIDSSMLELANLKVKDFAIKNHPIPSKELQLITLIAQREKLSRDEITSMMLAGEEALKMLIRNPS